MRSPFGERKPSVADILGLLVDDCHWEGDRGAEGLRAVRLVEIGVHPEHMLNMALLHCVSRWECTLN